MTVLLAENREFFNRGADMVRYILAAVVIGAYLITIPVYAVRGAGIAHPKNIILIVVDTLAADRLGFMGYERDTTPFLDELASQSFIFDRAYTPKSTTMPAFTSILSGLHPSQHGVIENGHKVPDDLHFLTEDLQDAGFETWGIPSARVVGRQFGFDRGFDYYANTSAIPHTADEMYERLERIMKNSPLYGEPSLRSVNNPLFLMLHFYDTHTPFQPDDEFLKKFVDPEYKGQVDGTWEQFEKYNKYGIEYNTADLKRASDLYDAEIRTFDEKLKRIFELLDEVGLLDNSIIILTADHGENLGEHHFITHGNPYEPALHVPLLVHFPDNRSGGKRISTVVENSDILPSILDLYDVELRHEMYGQSFIPLITPDRERDYSQRERFYSVGNVTDGGRMYGVFDGRYRLIFDTGKSDEMQLYDVITDPKETRNLMNDDEPELSLSLSRYLGEFISEMSDSVKAETVMDDETREALASLGYLQ